VPDGIGATGSNEFKKRGAQRAKLTAHKSCFHLVHWIHGGPTDLPNLALLCYRHHWMVHEGGWQIARGDGGRIVTIPATVTFGASPRGPD
jgi:hypothetical protein